MKISHVTSHVGSFDNSWRDCFLTGLKFMVKIQKRLKFINASQMFDFNQL